MARDWHTEWKDLCSEQDKAYQKYQAFRLEITKHFSDQGTPPDRLVRDVDTAHTAWQDSADACRRFLQEYVRARAPESGRPTGG